MKKKRRKILSLVLTVLMLAFSSLSVAAAEESGTDTAEATAGNTEEEIAEEIGSYITSGGQLYVGAAVELISPQPDMLPIERKASTDVVGIIEDTHVRVIAIGDETTTSLILSFEMGRGPYGPQYATALAEHTGIDVDAIFLTAGHVHAAPEITSETDLEGDSNQEKWAAYVMEQMILATDEAIANMEPAEVGIGYSESYINVNRNANYTDADGNAYRSYGFNGEGFSDHTLTAIEFNSLETGNPIAFIVSHDLHNIVMNANEYFDPEYEGINYTADEKYGDSGVCGLHPDVGGLVSLYLEENYEGSVALWLCGTAGDQGPLVMNQVWTPDPATGEQEENYISGASVEICEYLAKIQYADVKKALNSIEEFTSTLEISYAYGTSLLPPAESGGEKVTMGLQVLKLGDIVLAGTVGELYSSTGAYMTENSLVEDTLVVNCVWNSHETKASYYPDYDASIYGSANGYPKYDASMLEPVMSELLNNLLREINDGWQYHGDGTATNKETGETVLVGLDKNAGTEDDNCIVNPAGTVLLENVNVSCDADGEKFVSLGNGFKLYGGDDGILGTTDDVVKGFGSYQQGLTDEETTVQRQEPLDWYLLDIQDGTAILLSKYLIDGVQFNLNATDGNDWAGSNLRSWLNSTGGISSSGNEEGFYDTAFTDEEKEKIVLTEVNMNSDGSFIAYNTTKESDWWEYNTTSGEDTSDYVWVLSGEEAFEYFGLSQSATYEELGHDPENYTNGYFVPTEFAHEEAGVKINEGGNGPSFVGFGDSWTRSPGREADEEGNYYGVFWGSVGSLNSGRTVDRVYGALPAITVDLGQDDSDWTYLGDGTAVNSEGRVVLVGLDGVADSEDDNRIVNPAKTVLIENVELSYDEEGVVYVDLGNGFKLYGGADGLLGTQDDAVTDFGSYPQSDETGETSEPLSWLLLDLQGDEATLISTTVIDAASFNLDPTDGNDWANSNLRSWLNSTGGVSNGGDTVGFYDRAFTEEEKAKINLSEVRCDYTDWEKWTEDGDVYNYQDMTGNFPGYDRTIEMYGLYTTTGENTMDYVYAISGEEVFQYFDTSTVMNPEFYDLINFTNGYFPTTPYAISQGAKFNSSALQWMFNNHADSWTRSEGRQTDEEGNFYGIFWGSYGNMNSGRTVDAVYGTLPMIRVNVAG